MPRGVYPRKPKVVRAKNKNNPFYGMKHTRASIEQMRLTKLKQGLAKRGISFSVKLAQENYYETTNYKLR